MVSATRGTAAHPSARRRSAPGGPPPWAALRAGRAPLLARRGPRPARRPRRPASSRCRSSTGSRAAAVLVPLLRSTTAKRTSCSSSGPRRCRRTRARSRSRAASSTRASTPTCGPRRCGRRTRRSGSTPATVEVVAQLDGIGTVGVALHDHAVRRVPRRPARARRRTRARSCGSSTSPLSELLDPDAVPRGTVGHVDGRLRRALLRPRRRDGVGRDRAHPHELPRPPRRRALSPVTRKPSASPTSCARTMRQRHPRALAAPDPRTVQHGDRRRVWRPVVRHATKGPGADPASVDDHDQPGGTIGLRSNADEAAERFPTSRSLRARDGARPTSSIVARAVAMRYPDGAGRDRRRTTYQRGSSRPASGRALRLDAATASVVHAQDGTSTRAAAGADLRRRRARRRRIVGLMYGSFEREPARGFAGPNDHWHRHTNLCIDVRRPRHRSASRAARHRCDSRRRATRSHGQFMRDTLWMVHAWVVPGLGQPAKACSRMRTSTSTARDGTDHADTVGVCKGTSSSRPGRVASSLGRFQRESRRRRPEEASWKSRSGSASRDAGPTGSTTSRSCRAGARAIPKTSTSRGRSTRTSSSCR